MGEEEKGRGKGRHDHAVELSEGGVGGRGERAGGREGKKGRRGDT